MLELEQADEILEVAFHLRVVERLVHVEELGLERVLILLQVNQLVLGAATELAAVLNDTATLRVLL